jgi:hypothetical protein
LTSLLLFAGSVIAGLQRLRAVVTALGVEKDRLSASQRAGQLKTLLLNPSSTILVDNSTGQTFTRDQAKAEVTRSEQQFAEAQKRSNRWSNRADVSYNLRDWCLGVGVVLYAASKIWISLLAS